MYSSLNYGIEEFYSRLLTSLVRKLLWEGVLLFSVNRVKVLN